MLVIHIDVTHTVTHQNDTCSPTRRKNGGFSPTAVLKLRRLARKVARGSVDRTAYSPKYSLSFMSHHAARISLSVVRGVNRAIRKLPHSLSPAWQPRLHVSRARDQGVCQGSRPQMACEC